MINTIGNVIGKRTASSGPSSAPSNTVAPAVTGTARVGQTLSTTDGTWSNTPTSYTYQWKRNGSNIPGATNNTYLLVTADGGTSVICVVTATNAIGSTSANSNTISVEGVPVNSVAPSISGTLQIGQTLTSSTGTWSNNPTSYTYQWKRGGSNISSATNSTYVLVDADDGQDITVSVVGVNSAGSGSASTSSASQIRDFTSASGQQVFGWTGDSTQQGSNNSTGPGPTTTGKQWNATLGQITTIGSSDVYNVVSGGGTPIPQFCNTYMTYFPSYIPVNVPCGSSGSNFSPDGDTNNWSATGTLRADFQTKMTNALSAVGVSRPKHIVVGLGINDARQSEATSPIATVLSDIDSYFTWLTTNYPGTKILVSLIGRSEVSVITDRISQVRDRILTNAISNADIHIVWQMASMVGAGGYGADNLHPNQTGNNYEGAGIARWHNYTSYSKWARSIISCMYEDVSSTYKNKIDAFYTAVGNTLWEYENIHMFKASIVNNIFVDFTFRSSMTRSSGGYTVDDSISTTSTSAYWTYAWQTSIANAKMSQNDCFTIVKVKTNSTSAGTQVYLFGAIQTNTYALLQTSTSQLSRRVNDTTLSNDSTDTKFNDNTVYGVARNGTAQILLKGATALDTDTVASTGTVARFVRLGVLDNAGTLQQAINSSFYYTATGKYTTSDLATLISASDTYVS